jgi:hypothetical protein
MTGTVVRLRGGKNGSIRTDDEIDGWMKYVDR